MKKATLLGALALTCACRGLGKKSAPADAAAEAAAQGPTSTAEDRRGSLVAASASASRSSLPAAPARVDRVLGGRWPTFSVRANDSEAWLVFDRETEPVASAMAIASLLSTVGAFEKMPFASDDARFGVSQPARNDKTRPVDAGGGANAGAALLWAANEGTQLPISTALEKDPLVVTEYLATRYLTGRGDAPLLQTAQGTVVDAQFGDAFTQLGSGAAHPVWRRLGKDRVSPAFVKRLLAIDEGALTSLQDARGNAIECGVVRRHLIMQRRHELLSRIAP